jgi:uncharacterized iron-regulated protein
VLFSAGYANTAAVPADLAQVAAQMARDAYQTQRDLQKTDSISTIAMPYADSLRHYRRQWNQSDTGE